MAEPVYLDYNATTPIDPLVLDAMLPYLHTHFGNPSSDHIYGYRTRAAVAAAREQIAMLVGAHPDEVVFKGGGSEANNLALFGVAASQRSKGAHIISSTIEHPAVQEPLRALERQGYRLTQEPVDSDGRVDPIQIATAITPETILISIMHANNEVGTLQNVHAITDYAHAHSVLVHTDAAQLVGKVPARLDTLGVDLLTVAGHKLYAPKGVGALIVRKGIRLEPHVRGAGHEYGLRAGTENVPYIVGLGCAAELAGARLDTYQDHTGRLRNTLHERILAGIPDALLNGHPTERLPNTLNLSFPGVNAAALLARIRDQVACSTGSACHAGHAEPSSVLLAMGREPALAAGALRLSLGWTTTEADVHQAATVILAALQGE